MSLTILAPEIRLQTRHQRLSLTRFVPWRLRETPHFQPRVSLDFAKESIYAAYAQETLRQLPAPVIVVGSAGSGKTAVALAKLREAEGRVLYVTHSAYLAQSARALYACAREMVGFVWESLNQAVVA